jgi:hypothetical protein
VGLAARFLEEAGFSTVVLTPNHNFHRVVGIPRSAAIEYPYGRPLGQVGDQRGQREVLLQALSILEEAPSPGEIKHLPFTWPEEPKKTDWHPPEMSPLINLYLNDLKEARKREAEKAKARNCQSL